MLSVARPHYWIDLQVLVARIPRPWWSKVLLVSVASVGLITLSGFIGTDVIAARQGWGEGASAMFGARADELQALFVRWDANYYHLIASDGYPDVPDTRIGSFPLYPLIVRMLSLGSGLPVLWIGLGVSVAAFVGCGLVLYSWARIDYGDAVALRSVIALCSFPLSFFLVSFYAEPLFLLLTLASMWFARQGRFTLAGAMVGLAGATRPQAFLLSVPMIAEILLQRHNSHTWRRALGGLLLAPVGTLAYLVWLQRYTGAPNFVAAYLQTTSDVWRTSTTWPWVSVWDGLKAAVFGIGINSDWFSRTVAWHDLAYATLGAAAAIWSVRRLRSSMSAFLVVGAISLLVTHGPYGYALWGLPRRLAGLAPIYVALAVITRRLPSSIQCAALALSTTLLGILAAWFTSGRWVS